MIKKKIYSFITVILAGFFIYALIFPFKSYDSSSKWDSITTSFGGKRIQHAKKFAHQFHQSQTKGLENQIHPDLLPKLILLESHPTMKYFIKNQPKSVQAIGYSFQKHSGERNNTYFLQYDFVQKPPAFLESFIGKAPSQTDEPYSLLVTMQEQEKNNTSQIVGFSVKPISSQEKQMGKFRLHGKSPFQIAFLIISILVPLFIFYNLVQFIRMPQPCQKIMWFIFIALGFVSFTLNWTTAEISFIIFCGYLLGSAITKMGIYSPWMLSVSIPFGALIFFFKRKKLLAEYQKNITTQNRQRSK